MIEINNLTDFPIDNKLFSTVAKKVLSGENRETETLSLAFVDGQEIKKLNKKFRDKNEATDVLSFDIKEEGYLGEIVICPEIVKENAIEDGALPEKELFKVFIHGILHLCGYDHEKSEKEAEVMKMLQEKYLSEIK